MGEFPVVVIYYDGNMSRVILKDIGEELLTSTDPTDFGLGSECLITAVISAYDMHMLQVYVEGELLYNNSEISEPQALTIR